MDPVLRLVLLTTLAGAAMPVGASLARVERLRPRWLERELRHGVIAFGGGVLLAAVALVLVPQGTEALSLLPITLCFVAGGLAFLAIDRTLAARGTPAAQLVATLTDFVPEALALGASFAHGGGTGLLLALIIALQNLPEGFNAFREMRHRGKLPSAKILGWMWALTLLGPTAGLTGYFLFGDAPQVVGGIMLFASGGILYAVFQDIAPQAQLRRAFGPPFGAVLGFLLGLVGHEVLA